MNVINVLGISFGFHDASAALLIDGNFIAGAHEERFTRKKHDESFPKNAIDFCLEEAKISFEDLDQIVFHENIPMKLDRIINSSITNNSPEYLSNIMDYWINDDMLSIKNYISKQLSFPIEKISYVDHHLSHASSAFFLSPFKESAILTIDAVGEYETTTLYKGFDNSLTKLLSYKLPHSIGLIYSAYTSFLGFEVNEGEYKIMGMAAFGSPVFTEKLKTTFEVKDSGEIVVNEKYFEFITPTKLLYKNDLCKIFGEPRVYDTPFFTPEFIEIAPSNLSKKEKETLAIKNKYYADIAASLQKVTQETILKLARTALEKAETNNLCMAGGVALNSVANGLVRESLDLDGLFIQPAAGDGGTSLGAALYYTHVVKGLSRNYSFNSCIIGSHWSKDEIKKQLYHHTIEHIIEIEDSDKYFDLIADLLIQKNVIGWYNGRAEWGPRALGSRSIIADPRHDDIQEIVNQKIKFREPYRPFAPSVLADKAKEWFLFSGNVALHTPESFMLSIVEVKEEKKSLIPAITHVDGTARVQLVWEEVNPDYYKLINTFYSKTGVPVILNTSFNLRGEPIVNSPYDAIITFSYSDMDYLAIPPFIVKNYWKFGGRDEK